jgi:protein involved in polysaccharide export with SLBB domain
MKLATLLFFTIALVAGPAPQAQNQNLIRSGDVLVVKLVVPADRMPPKWRSLHFPIVKIVAVTPDGRLRLPIVKGLPPIEDLNVAGLGLGEMAQELEQTYKGMFKGNDPPFQVVIERGTVDALLRQ